MNQILSVPVILDPGLTQATMRGLAQFTSFRNRRPDWVFSKENQIEHRHVTANLFFYRGLCDPGDLKPSVSTDGNQARLPGKLSFSLTAKW